MQRGFFFPLDDPNIRSEELNFIQEDIIIVGHLPHLSRFSSMLLLWYPEREFITFRMAGVVGLERRDGGGTISWIMAP